jgi:TRAP-type C4-dicarboxylate transport system permease small subunit
MKQRLARFFDGLIDSLAYVASTLFVVIILLICIDVGMRYFFNEPQVWAAEVCEYLMFAIAFMGAPWLLKQGGHVNVDIVVDRVPSKTRRLLAVAAGFVGAAVCGILAWFGAAAALDAYRSGVIEVRTLDVPKYYFMVVMALGYLLLFIEFGRQSFRRILSLVEGA